MPSGQRPIWKFLTKEESTGKLVEIGAAWSTSKADMFSVKIDLEGTGEKIGFLMVRNNPKPEAVPAPTTPAPAKRAARPQPRP